MFICFGAAMFTLPPPPELSHGTDVTRIASQIIPASDSSRWIYHPRPPSHRTHHRSNVFVVASWEWPSAAAFTSRHLRHPRMLLVLYSWASSKTSSTSKFSVFPYESHRQNFRGGHHEATASSKPTTADGTTSGIAQTPKHFRVQFNVDGTFRENARFLAQLRECEI